MATPKRGKVTISGGGGGGSSDSGEAGRHDDGGRGDGRSVISSVGGGGRRDDRGSISSVGSRDFVEDQDEKWQSHLVTFVSYPLLYD
jgi:hypothetical protein